MADGRPRTNWQTTLERISVILVIVTASVALVRLLGFSGPAVGRTPARVEPPVPAEPVAVDGLWTKGSASAEVGMIVFADFECPACRHFATTSLPGVEKEYVDTGKVRLVFWHRPLPQHPRAVPAAQAADCAGREGKFWQMHDLLFENPRGLDDENLKRLASQIGLSRFADCFGEASSDAITKATAQVTELQVRGTPTVFVGRFRPDGRLAVLQRWSGSRPLESVIAVLDEILAAQR
jgi:protein-disulfide isomerase